jgi:hypothetical protein
MTKHAATQDEMSAAGLSEEEIAALEESEESGELVETDTDNGDGATSESDSEVLPQAADDESEGTVASKQEDDTTDDATNSGDKPDGGEEVAVVSPRQVDTFRAQLAARGIPEDYEDQLKAANDAIEALDTQLAEGEIDYAAHAKQNRALTTTLADLTAVKREAEFVAGNNEVIADQHWDWEVERFVEENDEFKNPVVYGALRGALEELYADPNNAGNAYRWFLREAGSNVRQAFNMEAKPTPAGAGSDSDEESRAAKIQQEHSDKPQDPPPKTLAGLPQASTEEESTDEFSHIDKLEGMDLEAALAKLPQAKVDKYLDTRSY